jgi:hypothetical protein
MPSRKDLGSAGDAAQVATSYLRGPAGIIVALAEQIG